MTRWCINLLLFLSSLFNWHITRFFYDFGKLVRGFNIQWEKDKGMIWNGSNNCQQYARTFIEHFKFTWPDDAWVIVDSLPLLIDYALYFNKYVYPARNNSVQFTKIKTKIGWLFIWIKNSSSLLCKVTLWHQHKLKHLDHTTTSSPCYHGHN